MSRIVNLDYLDKDKTEKIEIFLKENGIEITEVLPGPSIGIQSIIEQINIAAHQDVFESAIKEKAWNLTKTVSNGTFISYKDIHIDLMYAGFLAAKKSILDSIVKFKKEN